MGEVWGVNEIALGVSRHGAINPFLSEMFSDSEVDLCWDVEA